MLIIVIPPITTIVKTSQMPSIGDERHISDGRNASATARYRMPKPTSTHFVRIASPRTAQASREDIMMIKSTMVKSTIRSYTPTPNQ